MMISILVPVFNEKNTILEIFKKIQESPLLKEIIVVDDASTDGTREILKNLNNPSILCLYHDKNFGKGAAIRTALAQAKGEIILIQDADLEYDPKDYAQLLEPILDGRADVVYGSRFLGGPHRVLFFWHFAANKFFTLFTNILYNINLTDMGTCYKVFRSNVLKSMELKSNRFGFEPEVTAKICKKKLRIYETPISYSGRTYQEGKKISWSDGLVYFWCLLKYRFIN